LELIVVEGRNQQQTDVRSTGNRRRKAIAMSSNALLHEQTDILCRNPNSRPSGGLLQYSRELATQKVQGYIRLRELTRGVKAQIKTKSDQTYREITLAYLKKFISASGHQEKWKQLLLGADDDEVAATYLEYDREHAIEKARSLANALQVMYDKQTKRVRQAPGNRLVKLLPELHARPLTGKRFNCGIQISITSLTPIPIHVRCLTSNSNALKEVQLNGLQNLLSKQTNH
jgi:hypothetical protein